MNIYHKAHPRTLTHTHTQTQTRTHTVCVGRMLQPSPVRKLNPQSTASPWEGSPPLSLPLQRPGHPVPAGGLQVLQNTSGQTFPTSKREAREQQLSSEVHWDLAASPHASPPPVASVSDPLHIHKKKSQPTNVLVFGK